MRDTEGYIYKYETHCHTSWCSACGHNSPMEMAEAYFNAGYTGMIITDHFLRGNSAVDKSLPWEEKMKKYYEAYEAARDWAEGKDFHVLFGIENHYGDGKEVLTYGIDLDFLLEHPNLHLYTLKDYSEAVHKAGGVISMAHPYRHAPYINPDVKPQPKYLDGAEIFNFYTAGEDNKEAAILAEKHGLFPTSGGDEHSNVGASIGKAGLAFKEVITTGRQLVEVLKSEDYRVIVNGELV